MSVYPVETADGPESDIWTVDELANHVGLTVRTIRYYATLGLVPPPERRGRMAYYDGRHRARLQLIRTMQEQGLSLAAIEQQLARIQPDSPISEIEMRRALVSSWAPVTPTPMDRDGLERRAGRKLTSHDLRTLERLGALRQVDGLYEAGPTFEVGVELLDLDIPVESMEAAGEAISKHMNQLILELREVLRTQVLAPLRQQHGGTDTERFEWTMTRLRQLTLDALVGNFQQAAHKLVDGSLLNRADPDTGDQ